MRSGLISAICIVVLICGGGVFSADFNGDGTNDIGIFRANGGLWSVRLLTRFYLGSGSDRAVPGDYNGDGTVEGAIFRSGDGLWSVRGVTRVYLGTGYDDPLDGVMGNRGGGGGETYWAAGASLYDIYYSNGDVGIGVSDPTNNLHVRGNQAYSIVRVVNANTGSDGDGLSIELGALPYAGTNNKFIGFWDTVGAVGSICGNGSGGVEFRTTGSDFAEFMPRLKESEAMEAGDIVGIIDGKITRATRGAEQVQVISSAPIVLGNDPGETRQKNFEKVALLGHAPTKVEGPVRAGDYIIPSGRNDGTGVSISADKMTLPQCAQIVGRAVEAREEPGVKLVRTAVGINVAAPLLDNLSREKEAQIDKLSQRLQTLEERLSRIENRK